MIIRWRGYRKDIKLKKSTIYLSGFLIILILSVFVLFQNEREINLNSILKINISSLKKSNAKKKFTSYPEFSAVDIFGNKINPSTLKGSNVFIQFINPKLHEQVDLLKKIYFEFNEQELLIVVFTKDFKILKKEIRYTLGSIFFITSGYEKFKKIFQVPSCCESFYLFDKSGNLVITDFNWKGYEEGIKTQLQSLLKKIEFSIHYFIKSGENIRNIDWFDHLWKIIIREKTPNYHVISMFTRICSSCPSGRIINNLKELYKTSNKSAQFLSILSDNFSENDVNNLKINLGIKFPMIKADEKLANKWNKLIKEFRETDLNNIVFLIDKKGQILSVMQSNNQEEFFTYLSDKIRAKL